MRKVLQGLGSLENFLGITHSFNVKPLDSIVRSIKICLAKYY